ncbi:hypothetical protein FSARC_10814 [Fusarium sarcochroum]|uniref:F-box domain-containing protein n=1 Tax=Fusarium sarcochroum TaxID=1208366 RepID=A0A8H4X225_9HYPO|nr:hypothetical protein FSARC_10814 [Fusarium sarcochroum]
MDIFATLPPELIAPILSNLPNLGSLFSIVKASPYVFHFLDGTMGAEVLDDVLDSSAQNLLSTPWIPYILRLVALIRQCDSIDQPTNDLTSLIIKFIMPTTFQNAQGERVPDLQSCPPDCVPEIRLRHVMKGPQAFSPREMLFLIRKINMLAGGCFDFFHERIKATEPQHLTDKCYHLGTLPWKVRPDGKTWGQSYEINAGGEASWYETQRIVLGFWCLQLCYELSNAASEGRLDWSASDVEAVRDMGSGETCLSGLKKSSLWIAREPLWAALSYVRYLEGTPDESPCVGDTDVVNRGLSVFFNTGYKPLCSEHLKLPPPKHGTDSRLEWPVVVSRPPPFPCVEQKDAFTYHCHKVLVGCKGLRWAGPLLCPRGTPRLSEGLLFRPFRRLGFGIWDDERLVAMEMLDDPENKRPRRFHVWCQDQVFTWTSLLSPEEKEELQVHQEAMRLREEHEFGELIVTSN